MTTQTETRTRMLTPAELAYYAEKGYLVLPGLLSQADLAPARAAMTAKVDQIAAELMRDGLVNDPLVGDFQG